MRKTIPLLDPEQPLFPPIHEALDYPDGLLAMGGNLESNTLANAYQKGIFPWFNDGEPILWWSPNPRMVLYPDELHISRSMKRFLKKHPYRVSFDEAFDDVMTACSLPRNNQDGTWIIREMKDAYSELFHQGLAHSVEVWSDDKLIGGLYGVAIDKIFFGESMFSFATNTSKLAMTHLCRELQSRNFQLVDCQIHSPHLESLGARMISREAFLEALKDGCRTPSTSAHWKLTGQWTAGPNERT
ncbi:leucyl/phenylalanyl-tRNA--protein transferase [Endozoicomonas arenosclerae]|uniref:leucyl/phenylalanyl-tRNA--protein transferase n=1 Tax=Endozoicomonas arenosclerae TaxID=1633495 RepID=UPI000783765E|nr:leucyl/phenylalanyl-tRNA--protein transferase [Endozoicomonas arenosclerae]